MQFRGDDLYLGLAVAIFATSAVSIFLWARRKRRRLPLLHAAIATAALLMLSVAPTLPDTSAPSLDVVRATDAGTARHVPPPLVRGERPTTPPRHMTVVPVPTTTPVASVRAPLSRPRTVPVPTTVVAVPTTVTTVAAPVVTAASLTTTTVRQPRSDDENDD